MEIPKMRSESLLALGNSRGEQPHRSHLLRDPLSGRASRHTPQTRAVGLVVFDHKGRLVAADARAELILAGLGVEANCGGRLRIDARATSTAGTLGGWGLPEWLYQ
jgi:hypothetical protein